MVVYMKLNLGILCDISRFHSFVKKMDIKRKASDGTVAIPTKKPRNEVAFDVGSIGVCMISVFVEKHALQTRSRVVE